MCHRFGQLRHVGQIKYPLCTAHAQCENKIFFYEFPLAINVYGLCKCLLAYSR